MRHICKQTGFTLIECLVTISIIGLLTAFLMPAVQQARESAHKVRCAHNLREISIAVQSYHALFNVFPSTRGGRNWGPDGRTIGVKPFSLFTQILPQLEEINLFNNCNFDATFSDPYRGGSMAMDTGYKCNATVMSVTLQVFLCPSDWGGGVPGWTGGSNYRANLGTERWYFSSDGPLMGRKHYISAAATTDGLSHTVALSEKLRGRSQATTINPRTDMIVGGLDESSTVEESLNACRERRGAPQGFHTYSGLAWFVGSLAHTCYNHTIEPNSVIPDCVRPGSGTVNGLFGARSNHHGGVQVAMADGSVRFVKNTVQRSIWKALGSRAGREIISEHAYNY